MHISDTKAKLQFIGFVKVKYPSLYKKAISKATGLNGLGDAIDDILSGNTSNVPYNGNVIIPGSGAATPINAYTTAVVPTSFLDQASSTFQNIIDKIVNLAPSILATKQANTCIQVNAQRAKNGLAPIDCSAQGLAPTVAVGLSPNTQTIIYVGLGIAAVAVLMGAKKRK